MCQLLLDQVDYCVFDMDKRRSRNLSEKKRRDQFNSLISDLGAHLSEEELLASNNTTNSTNSTSISDLPVSSTAAINNDNTSCCPSSSAINNNNILRHLDKSSVLKSAIDFLKQHERFNTNTSINSNQNVSSSQQTNIIDGSNNNESFQGDIGGDSNCSYNNNDDYQKSNHHQQAINNITQQQHYDDCSSEQQSLNIAPWKPTFITDDEFSVLMLEALDAFIIVCEVSDDAKILYASDSVMTLLDYSGLKLCTTSNNTEFVSIYDLIAPNDKHLIETLFKDRLPAEQYDDISANNNNHHKNGQDSMSQNNKKNITKGSTDRERYERFHSLRKKDDDYVRLMVNFRNGLNLTNIKRTTRSQSSESDQFDHKKEDNLLHSNTSSIGINLGGCMEQGQYNQDKDLIAIPTCADGSEKTHSSQQVSGNTISPSDLNVMRDTLAKVEGKTNNMINTIHKDKQHQQKQSQRMFHQQRQQYEPIRLMGTFKIVKPSGLDAANSNPTKCFIGIGRLEVPRLSYDLKIIVSPTREATYFHNNQFASRHTLKWKFLWLDARAPPLIGYSPFEVLGTSGYDYYHWDDLDRVVTSHEGLMRDGQGATGPYRFLTKGQQWIWLQTKYSIIHKPQYATNNNNKQYINDLEINSKPQGTIQDSRDSSDTSMLPGLAGTNQGSIADNWYNNEASSYASHTPIIDCVASPGDRAFLGADNDERTSEQQLPKRELRQNNNLNILKSSDKFKCILCTHTVIGFDEDENHTLLPTLSGSKNQLQQQTNSMNYDNNSNSSSQSLSTTPDYNYDLSKVSMCAGVLDRPSLSAEPPPASSAFSRGNRDGSTPNSSFVGSVGRKKTMRKDSSIRPGIKRSRPSSP